MKNKENTGVLFPNNKTKDNQPDYRGEAKIGSVDFFMSAWKNKSKNGNDYLSIAFQKVKPKEEKKEVKQDTKQGYYADMNDDIPW